MHNIVGELESLSVGFRSLGEKWCDTTSPAGRLHADGHAREARRGSAEYAFIIRQLGGQRDKQALLASYFDPLRANDRPGSAANHRPVERRRAFGAFRRTKGGGADREVYARAGRATAGRTEASRERLAR